MSQSHKTVGEVGDGAQFRFQNDAHWNRRSIKKRGIMWRHTMAYQRRRNTLETTRKPQQGNLCGLDYVKLL